MPKPSEDDLIGSRFGRLVVIAEAENVYRTKKRPAGMRASLCECDCGNKTVIPNAHFGRDAKSCGCYQKELAAARNTIHGMSKLPEYQAWHGMIKRCTNPDNQSWDDYGGRGIKVCDEWIESFESFFAHVGPKPTPQHSIDRINNDGNYEPGNVRWATQKEQANNKRCSRRFVADDEEDYQQGG